MAGWLVRSLGGPLENLDSVVEPAVVVQVTGDRAVETSGIDRDGAFEEESDLFGEWQDHCCLIGVKRECLDNIGEALIFDVLLETIERASAIEAAAWVA